MADKSFLSEYRGFVKSRSVHTSRKAILRLLKDYGPEIFDFIWGIAGESGEFVEKIKRAPRDHKGVINPRMRRELLKELGDKVWYITAMAELLDSTLEEILRINKRKLQSRYKRRKIHGAGDSR